VSPDTQNASEEAKLSVSHPTVFNYRSDPGVFVGARQSERFALNLRGYSRYNFYGEAVTAVQKTLAGDWQPYQQHLRDYKGIGRARLVRDFGSAMLSDIVAQNMLPRAMVSPALEGCAAYAACSREGTD
jgi:hypothetical protein